MMPQESEHSKTVPIDFRELLTMNQSLREPVRYVFSRTFGKTPLGRALLELNKADHYPSEIVVEE